MTQEEKINYMSIVTKIVGYPISKKDLDMIVSLYDLIIEKQGETDVESVIKVQFEVEERRKENLIKEKKLLI